MQPSGFDRKGPGTDPRQGKARTPERFEIFGNRLLGQIGFIVGVILGVAALIVVVGSLDDATSPVLRIVAIGILVGLALGGIFLVIRRRHDRQSIDDALRSRRQ